MHKKRLRVVLTVLDAAKTKYPETKRFIDGNMEEAFQKEKISADEIRVSSEKHFLFCSECVKSSALDPLRGWGWGVTAETNMVSKFLLDATLVTLHDLLFLGNSCPNTALPVIGNNYYSVRVISKCFKNCWCFKLSCKNMLEFCNKDNN